ncbi:MAG TPA: hypothetical protein VJP78_15520 [Thermoleophilia bacterium]|nr:hypothetical protein [Thermoleophilia bacterium]
MTFHRLVELIRESVREADSVGALDDEIALTLTAGELRAVVRELNRGGLR